MQKKEIEKDWNQLHIAIQQKWNKLTAGDLYEIDGMYDEFVNRIVKRYGYSRETAEKEIENWHPHGGHKAERHEWPQKEDSSKHQQHGQQNPNQWKQKKRKAG